MAPHQAEFRTAGKVEIKKMWRLQEMDTHFFHTTLAKRTSVLKEA
jgi:hypothetical protein